MFNQNERVNTPMGPGVVVSRRMAGPDYRSVQAYSILLDCKVTASKLPPFPTCGSTVFPSNQVEAP